MIDSSKSTVKLSAISRENHYAFVILNVLDGVFSSKNVCYRSDEKRNWRYPIHTVR